MNETNNKAIRIGVIGAGAFASRRHLPSLVESSDAEIVALCRRNQEMLVKMADHFNVERTFTDYCAMLDNVEMDGVLVASPHALHYEHAKAALERNLHVLIEKPMTVRSDEARDLIVLAEAKKRVLLIALNPPYWAHGLFLQKAIQDGEIGEIEAININWVGDVREVYGKIPFPENLPGVVPPTTFRADPKMAGGGHLLDGGSHLVCEILWATKLRPIAVSAIMDDADTDLRCAVNLRLENGAFCTISLVGDSEVRRRFHSTYFGSKGTLIVDGIPFKVTMQKPDGELLVHEEDQMETPQQPVDNFIDAILGRAQPLSTGDDGLRVVEVIEAAYQSSRTGEIISLSL